MVKSLRTIDGNCAMRNLVWYSDDSEAANLSFQISEGSTKQKFPGSRFQSLRRKPSLTTATSCQSQGGALWLLSPYGRRVCPHCKFPQRLFD